MSEYSVKDHHLIRTLALLLLMLEVLAGCSHSADWTDEVVLHDGRVINIEREVIFKMTGGEPNPFTKWPTAYRLKVVNPDTKERVSWSGDDHVYPIAFDIERSVMYLVVLVDGRVIHKAKYGCPFPPYVFLKYERAAHEWKPIPRSEAPMFMRQANMSAAYDSSFNTATFRRALGPGGQPPAGMVSPRRFRVQTRQDIAERNKLHEHVTQSFFQNTFPESEQTWRYPYKNESKKECR